MSKQKDAAKRVTDARLSLILDQPFFGSLALRLPMVEDNSIPTMATDSVNIYWNRAFVDSLSHDEIKGVICHEVMHCAFGHHARRENRHPLKWNIAADYAINPLIIESGMKLPAGVLVNPKFTEMGFAERIYAALPDEVMKDGKSAKAAAMGEVRDAPGSRTEAGASAAAQEWEVAARAAAQMAEAIGRLPAGLKRAIGAALAPKVDWQSILKRFSTASMPKDYTWASPNRRFIGRGVYLPSIVREGTPPLVIGWDTSGSTIGPMTDLFAAEIKGLVQLTRPERVAIVYCDAAVASAHIFERDEELVFDVKGGGGTDFRPVFGWIDKNMPDCSRLIYFTDLAGTFPKQAPHYPVLWAKAGNWQQEVPFGEVAEIR